jgi:hypothetical protein
MKITITKSQVKKIPITQYPNNQTPLPNGERNGVRGRKNSVIGNWILFGFWCLVLGD